MVGELAAAPAMTLGADKGYDTADFVAEMRRPGVTPHVAQNNKNRRSAIDGRTMRQEGYAISQRKRIEETFGWMKSARVLPRRGIAARLAWDGCSRALRLPIISSGCPSCWRLRLDLAGSLYRKRKPSDLKCLLKPLYSRAIWFMRSDACSSCI